MSTRFAMQAIQRLPSRQLPLPPEIPYLDKLDYPLLQLSPHRADRFTLSDALTGVHVTGSTGSGKSSATAQHLALSYLRAGFGGIVLCAKAQPSEWDAWSDYAARTGRLGQLIRFDEAGAHKFNFLDYFARMNLDAHGRLLTDNVVNFLQRMKEAATRGDELSGRGAESPFWTLAPRELLSHTVDALWAGTGRLRLDELIRFIQTAPRKAEDFGSDKALKSSFCLQVLHRAAHQPVRHIPPQDLYVVMHYFRDNFAPLDPETRSNIVTTTTSQFVSFQKGIMREKFCTDTTLVPELCFEGAIIVLDFAIDRYHETGSIIQHLFKYLFQQAALRRDTKKPVRSCFIFADESQYFITPTDVRFQTVARSKRVSTVYLTQTISNYMAMIGGSTPRESTMALLANFVTKIAHRNDDRATNDMMAEMIGKDLQVRGSYTKGFNAGSSESSGSSRGSSRNISVGSSGHQSTSSSGHGDSDGMTASLSFNSGWSASETFSEQMDYDLQPGEFTYLRSGGIASADTADHYLVDGIWFQAGRRFRANGRRNYLPLTFDQRVGLSVAGSGLA